MLNFLGKRERIAWETKRQSSRDKQDRVAGAVINEVSRVAIAIAGAGRLAFPSAEAE